MNTIYPSGVGSPLEEVFSLSNFQRAPGMRAWKGLAPDDTPLLIRDAGTMDIYALDVVFP